MNNKEKENREYEEFLKFYAEQYGAKQKEREAAPAANQLPQTGLNQPQEKLSQLWEKPSQPQEKTNQPRQQTANRTHFKKQKTKEHRPAGGRQSEIKNTAALTNTALTNAAPTNAALTNAAPTNAAQPLQTPGAAPKNSPQRPPCNRAVKKHRPRQRGLLLCLALAAVLLAAVLFALFGPSKTDVLKGTWSLDGVTVYQFDGKGNGSLNLPENSYAFTYEMKDHTLAINFKDKAAQNKTYTFTVENTKLMLTEGEAKTQKAFEFTKQAE